MHSTASASQPPLYRLACPPAPFQPSPIIEASLLSLLTISLSLPFVLIRVVTTVCTDVSAQLRQIQKCNGHQFQVCFLHNSVNLQIDEDCVDSFANYLFKNNLSYLPLYVLGTPCYHRGPFWRIYSWNRLQRLFEARGLNALLPVASHPPTNPEPSVFFTVGCTQEMAKDE